MKSALVAIGALALGASAFYYLDPKRARAVAQGRTRRGGWSPPARGESDVGSRGNVEPGEIEEIAGSPAVSPTARTPSSETAPGTSGISTPGAPTSGTGAYGIGAGGSATGISPSGETFSLPPHGR